jgi:hypothetical protein
VLIADVHATARHELAMPRGRPVAVLGGAHRPRPFGTWELPEAEEVDAPGLLVLLVRLCSTDSV